MADADAVADVRDPNDVSTLGSDSPPVNGYRCVPVSRTSFSSVPVYRLLYRLQFQLQFNFVAFSMRSNIHSVGVAVDVGVLGGWEVATYYFRISFSYSNELLKKC